MGKFYSLLTSVGIYEQNLSLPSYEMDLKLMENALIEGLRLSKDTIRTLGSSGIVKMRSFVRVLMEFSSMIEEEDGFAAIGAVDSPVVKDVKTNLPMIPGSSLKGKMRSLLAKEFNEQITEPKGDHERISRLFGSSEKNKIKRSRLLFSDMVLANEQELREAGLQSMTEVKFENSISRLTAVANPRQIERVVRGSVFELDLIYEMENEQEFIEDMQTLAEGMKLLQYDYLGGSGSRGYGKIQFNNVHAEGVIGKQSALYDTEFAATLAMKILCAKIKNQSVVLRRYEKSRGINLEEEQKMLTICKNKIMTCNRIEEMIGFEGQAAKYYFKGLAACIDKEFSFQGRSRRPPRDEFNSMISLGYSILMNEVYCKIEMKGLNPYFGFIHRDAEKHPTLASDMMEEWRAVIVDATAMSMINGHEIQKEHFNFSMDEPGCYLTRDGLKIYLNKLERKFQTEVRYLKYVDYAVSFRRGIFLQMEHLAKAIEEGNANLYEPITIR